MSDKKNDQLPYVIILIMAIVAMTALATLFFRSSPSEELEPYDEYLVEEQSVGQEVSQETSDSQGPEASFEKNTTIPPLAPTTSEDEILEKGLLPNGQVPPTPGGTNTRRIINVRPSSELLNVPVKMDALGNPIGEVPNPDYFPELEPTTTP